MSDSITNWEISRNDRQFLYILQDGLIWNFSILEHYNIRAVLDPRTNRELTLLDGIKEGLFNQANGNYNHPVSGEVIPLDRAIALGLVLTDRPVSRAAVSDVDSELAALR